MIDFEIKNDTKLLLRNNPIEELTGIIRSKKVLFVYGEGSVYKNGCYNDINKPLKMVTANFLNLVTHPMNFQSSKKGFNMRKKKALSWSSELAVQV